MKLIIEIAAFTTMAVSALLWFRSAMVRLTRIGPGLDELDGVTKLSTDKSADQTPFGTTWTTETPGALRSPPMASREPWAYRPRRSRVHLGNVG
jgi:hypothetical protein